MPTTNDPWSGFSALDVAQAPPINYQTLMKKPKKPPVKEKAKAEPVPLVPKKGFTFGCDPEGFLFDKKSGLPVPAAGIIPGTKAEPEPLIGGAVQRDGMAVEFNIDPASTYEEWEDNITGVIAQIEKMIPKSLEIRWVPSVRFPEDAFDAAPDEAKELGCQPDFNAWDGGTNPTPRPEDKYVRCAGGHLHTGWTKNEDLSDLQHILNCQDLGKQFDWYLGGWSAYQDEDTVRRSIYGKMGAIRYKPYGMEYRVLSNFWVPKQELRLEVWNRMVTAVENVSAYFIPEMTNSGHQSMLMQTINDHKKFADLEYIAEFPMFTLDSRLCRLRIPRKYGKELY